MSLHRYPIGFALAAALVWSPLTEVVSVAVASPDHGTGDDAMPGVIRTDSAQALSKGLAISASSSYGFTGETLEAGDTHHRGAGRLALAYSLSEDLALAFRMDGRYDKHFLEAGRDDGWVGDPRLLARYRHTLGPSLSAGVQVGIWAPGSNAPSVEFDALSAELVAALTWASPSMPLQVSANVGYRLDRSAASVEEPERLSLSDRMSLGLSDYNAVLAAVGVSYDVGPVEVLGEWSLDLLHGSGAPGFRSSPMRIAAGARHQLSNGWYLFGTSEFRISEVLTDEVSDMLLPFDPRVSVLAGLQLRFGGAKTTKTLIEDDDKDIGVKPLPVEATTGPLKGTIVSDDKPVPGATLVITDASGKEHTVTTGEDGSYSIDEVALGEATIKVDADGFEGNESTISVAEEGSTATVQLEAILPPGQLRGRVQSYKGTGLESSLSVEPGGKTIETDAGGNFELDLPPGDYEVTIKVPGFKPQTRKIHVDENGVTIMNVDLRRRDRDRSRKP